MAKTVREQYEVRGTNNEPLQIEYVRRTDWNGMSDPCPECNGTEFNHVRYEGGHYGREGKSTVLRTDYWNLKGDLYTACKTCDTVLSKSPAYDLLQRIGYPDRE